MAVKTFTVGSDDPAGYTNIESAPKIAEQIGLVFATFALIEQNLPKLYSWITNMDKGDAAASLDVIRSFSTRLEIVEAVLANHAITPKPQLVASWFCKKIKEANSLRNRYAHAHYQYLAEDKVVLLPYGDVSKRIDVNLADMENDVAKLRKLAGQLFELFRMGRVPPDLFAEMQKLS